MVFEFLIFFLKINNLKIKILYFYIFILFFINNKFFIGIEYFKVFERFIFVCWIGSKFESSESNESWYCYIEGICYFWKMLMMIVFFYENNKI